MRVQVLFFASLKDEVGKDSLSLEVEEPGSLDALFEALSTQLEQPAIDVLRRENVRIALNQQLLNQQFLTQQFNDAPLQLCAGDELAFLPPVTGG